jgi:hypothetical protein
MKSFNLPKLSVGKKSESAAIAAKAPDAKQEQKPKAAQTARKAEPNTKPLNSKKTASGGKKHRFVLIIGDEGAILVFLEGRTVLRRLFAASADIDNVTPFREILDTNPKVPIYTLVDVMDQSYIKHTLPPVTKFSVGKLIKRRLERDFGPEDITGALPLGRESGGRKDWNYMLISVAGSPQLMQWLDFVLAFDNPFEGIYLVPIESAAFLHELSKTALGKNSNPWQLLVCHNKVGGFRQVIFKAGKLTFTRLAQPIGDTSPEVIAGSIEQEIGNTIEYLKRLSYTEEAGLDCFIVVSAEIKKYIESSKIKADNVVVLSPFEAGEILQLNKAALPEDHYADVVFASHFGLSTKKMLALQTTFSAVLFKYRKIINVSLLAGATLTALLLAATAYNSIAILPKMEEKDKLELQLRVMGAAVAAANQKVATLPKDIDRIEDIMGLDKIFTTNKEQTIQFIKDFRIAVQRTVIVKRLTWKNETKLEDVLSALPQQVTIDMDVEFVDSTGTIDNFSQRARDFFKRIQNAFPQYTVTFSKLPGVLDQEQAFRAEFKETENAQSKELMSGEPVVISIKFVTATNPPAVAP